MSYHCGNSRGNIFVKIDLCHPEGICHDAKCWPTSVALDPTEGPYRERRRLMPAYITFDLRFLRPAFAEKAKNRERSPPLSDLLVVFLC